MGSLRQAAEIRELQDQVRAFEGRLDVIENRMKAPAAASGQLEGRRKRPRGKKRGRTSLAKAMAGAASQDPNGDSGE